MKPFNLSDRHLKELLSAAQYASCTRSKCGAIILAPDREEIIGAGYNSMPCNLVEECSKELLPAGFPSDKTCCVHAEQRAIMDALKRKPGKVAGSTLIFVRLDKQGNPIPAKNIYCTICSKMALDACVSFFVLLTDTGWISFPTDEYNILSFLQADIPINAATREALSVMNSN